MQIVRDFPGCYWLKLGRMEAYISVEDAPYYGVWQTDDGWIAQLGTRRAEVSWLNADGSKWSRRAECDAAAAAADVIERARAAR